MGNSTLHSGVTQTAISGCFMLKHADFWGSSFPWPERFTYSGRGSPRAAKTASVFFLMQWGFFLKWHSFRFILLLEPDCVNSSYFLWTCHKTGFACYPGIVKIILHCLHRLLKPPLVIYSYCLVFFPLDLAHYIVDFLLRRDLQIAGGNPKLAKKALALRSWYSARSVGGIKLSCLNIVIANWNVKAEDNLLGFDPTVGLTDQKSAY